MANNRCWYRMWIYFGCMAAGLGIFNQTNAQKISKAEYFYDTDPGKGNGFPLPVGAIDDSVSFTSVLPTTGLSSGPHVLFIRTCNVNGQWSLYEPKFFYIRNSIADAEYFFDTDPGVGNGTPITITPSIDSIQFSLGGISTTGLAVGQHFLFIRTRDEKGKWSLYEKMEFFIRQSINRAEYFFDTDPGVGNGTALTITPALDSLTFTQTIPTLGLAEGQHVLFVRTCDNTGKWSLYQPRPFYIRVRIERAEYFIDTDPGIGNGTPITVPVPSDSISITANLITPGSLINGTHYLFVRTRDSRRIWSLYEPLQFTVDNSLPVEWLSFEVNKVNDYALLTWSTATETRCDYYQVEKMHPSDNPSSQTFDSIGVVQGNGTTPVLHTYSFTDNEIQSSGTYYYRLKQMDEDGRFTYSEIRSLTMGSYPVILIYPNPSDNFFHAEVNGLSGRTCTLTVFDETGRQVMQSTAMNRELKFGYDWPNGIYIVQLTIQDEITLYKLVKTR